jgi:mRNA interferase YafQ
MLGLHASTRFKKDLKLCQKQGKNIDLLKEIIDTLRIPESLPEKNRDHSLSGNYGFARECHIQPDWLLIYRVKDGVLWLERTGSHSDLFM